MKISQINISNIRGFYGEHEILLSPKINLLIGKNNSGKSTIIKSLLMLQYDKERFSMNDVSLGLSTAEIKIHPEFPVSKYFNENSNGHYYKFLIKQNLNISFEIRNSSGGFVTNNVVISNIEPHNYIYPYLSKRKTTIYSEEINSRATDNVNGNFENLYAKIDRLSNPNFVPAHEEYQQACKEIIGFPITTVASPHGKKAAVIIKNLENIPLTSMGEGVANLLGLIVDLCIAENKLFLIEEPENDIHPQALKALLELISKKSEKNQFIISTHSNIVAKYLGSHSGTKIFRVASQIDSDPERKWLCKSSVKKIGDSKEDRLTLLEELGYEFYDYDLWKGWIFFEESSAEEIVREFFIPLFVPKLKGRTKTYSARSLTEVIPKFRDFNNLFVFLHLEPIYKNKVWVIVDQGAEEKKIIDQLKETYCKKNNWEKSNFLQFSKHDFEEYYPERFKTDVDKILSLKGNDKRKAKANLLVQMKDWINKEPELAKKEFAISAKEVIDILKMIEKNINSSTQ